MDQSKAPYFEALRNYLDERVLSFHIPGHQQARALPEEFAKLLKDYGGACDITEVLGIDDLHNPHDQVELAQELAAQACGAQQTRFLVGGSTVANQAMFLSTLSPGDTVLMPLNSHRSAYSALFLTGAKVCHFSTSFDEQLLVHRPPTAEEVRRALEANPSARALFLTSPTYHGLCAPLAEIVKLAHERNMLVLLDEAWGAHLPFHPELPQSGLSAGVDMVCQSSHKLLPSLTQTAMLHFNPVRVSSDKVAEALRALQTSSPSSLFVASLDCVRRMMALQGETLLGELLRLTAEARNALSELPYVPLLEPEGVFDPTRLVFDTLSSGHTGHSVAEILRNRYSIQIEMSETHQILAILTLGHDKQDTIKLQSALSKIKPREADFQRSELANICRWDSLCEARNCTVREAFFRPRKSVNLEKAVDQTCAELLYCYPPGVPFLVPGQRISQNAINYIKTQKQLGSSIQGGADSELLTIQVC